MDKNIESILATVNFIKDRMLTKDEGVSKPRSDIIVAASPSPCRPSLTAPATVPVCSRGTNRARWQAMNAFVASGLIKRRVELAGDIEKANEALRCMVQYLENLDATILQFEPDFRVEAIKPKASGRRRKRGTEVARRRLSVAAQTKPRRCRRKC